MGDATADIHPRRPWPRALAIAALVVALAGAGCGEGTEGAVSVFPLTGAIASPETQISIRGADRDELEDVEVRGTHSDLHSGRWRDHPDGRGASFDPIRPFSHGESVTVHVGRRVAGIRDGRVRFRIARVPRAALPEPPPARAGVALSAVQSFRTRPDLSPPQIEITTPPQEKPQGRLFVAPRGGESQPGPMIFDPNGELVWFRPLTGGDQAFDFRAQVYQDKPVLTWLEGRAAGDVSGRGVGRIYDTAYRPVASVRAGNGYRTEIHDFDLSPRGTAWILARQAVPYDLTPFGGPRDGTVADQIVQEVDVDTGLVLFEWHSLGKVPLAESYEPVPASAREVYDPVHLNSIEEEQNGNVLVSARNTHAVYELDRRTGAIRWRLGGKHSTFDTGGVKLFEWQHDARRRPSGSVTVYDNEADGTAPRQGSRGLLIKLDNAAKTATIDRTLIRRPPVIGRAGGNVQVLGGGRALVGWGAGVPRVTEFDRTDLVEQVVFDARFVSPHTDTYRAFRLPWNAEPGGRPVAAALSSGTRATVYASWNGATAVARWRVLAGLSPEALRPARDAPREGFETRIPLLSQADYVAVQALSSSGDVLAQSAVVRALS